MSQKDGHDPYQQLHEEQKKDTTTKDELSQDMQDIEWLMSSVKGRRIMARIQGMCGMWSTSMTGNSMTYYNEGRRSVAIELTNDILIACPERFTTMLTEFNRNLKPRGRKR